MPISAWYVQGGPGCSEKSRPCSCASGCRVRVVSCGSTGLTSIVVVATFSPIHRASLAGSAPATRNTACTIHGSTTTCTPFQISRAHRTVSLRAVADKPYAAGNTQIGCSAQRFPKRRRCRAMTMRVKPSEQQHNSQNQDGRTTFSLHQTPATPADESPCATIREHIISSQRVHWSSMAESGVSHPGTGDSREVDIDMNEVESQSMTGCTTESCRTEECLRTAPLAGCRAPGRRSISEHRVPDTHRSRACLARGCRLSPTLSGHGVSVEAASRAAGLTPPTRRSTRPSPASWTPPVTPTANCCRRGVLRSGQQYRQRSQRR